MIEIVNLSKSFPRPDGDVVALQNINLTIDDGDIYGIIGLSGAGKSTLVRCINFLEKPTSGDVIIDGVNIGELSAKELRSKRKEISMIFQGFNLLSQRTALRNVCYPLEISGVPRAQAVAKARELLKIVGLQDRENSYPSMLSGGQKQRVAIARALATNPKVLLCDEATSALDPTTTVSILELLRDINKNMGVTIVIITHEMKVIEKICNKVAVLDNSVVAEEGAVRDVFFAPKADITKELIMPSGTAISKEIGKRKIRLVFDGEDTLEPVIANMILECHAVISILSSDVKNIDGKTLGQMLIQLPENPAAAENVLNYLRKRNITFEEVE